MDYLSCVRKAIVDPAYTHDVWMSQSCIALRDSREPWYSDPTTGCSVFEIATCQILPQTDGGVIEGALRLGGGNLAATAPAVLTFPDQYGLDGRPRSGSSSYTFFGSLPGTHTMARQRADGVNIVALFNQRTDPSRLDRSDTKPMLDDVADKITRWP